MLIKKKLSNYYITCLIALGFVFILIFLLNAFITKNKETEIVTIAIMKDDRVQNYNENYYKIWLEDKTGYQIEFVYIPPKYYKEYISALLSVKESPVDGIFLPMDMEIISKDEFHKYVNEDAIANVMDYMSADSNLQLVLEYYQDLQILEEMTESDGGIYYMPRMDTSRQNKNFQVFWINISWLKKLGIDVPKTTEGLYHTLNAFKEFDANGNGIIDEIPLISCEGKYELQSYNYLINAFIPNDPYRKRFYYDEEGQLHNALTQEAFRDGLKYCRDLYQEGLLVIKDVEFSKRQLQELVNDPADLVGAFTSKSIADVAYINSQDVLARYIQMSPIAGPYDEKNAIMQDLVPIYGGIIPANSKNGKGAFKIMDTMLSEKASLISMFGEEGVDWMFAEDSDLSTYGTKAKITTRNYLADKVQNKHFMGAGPQVVYEKYIDHVTWNGDSSNVEYINSRAILGYEPYYLKTYPDREFPLQEDYETYINEMIIRYIQGEQDISDEDAWRIFQKRLMDFCEDNQ